MYTAGVPRTRTKGPGCGRASLPSPGLPVGTRPRSSGEPLGTGHAGHGQPPGRAGSRLPDSSVSRLLVLQTVSTGRAALAGNGERLQPGLETCQTRFQPDEAGLLPAVALRASHRRGDSSTSSPRSQACLLPRSPRVRTDELTLLFRGLRSEGPSHGPRSSGTQHPCALPAVKQVGAPRGEGTATCCSSAIQGGSLAEPPMPSPQSEISHV